MHMQYTISYMDTFLFVLQYPTKAILYVYRYSVTKHKELLYLSKRAKSHAVDTKLVLGIKIRFNISSFKMLRHDCTKFQFYKGFFGLLHLSVVCQLFGLIPWSGKWEGDVNTLNSQCS